MKKIFIQAVFVLTFLAVFLSTAHAEVWYVDNETTTGDNGTMWQSAFDTIQEAIDAATAGQDEIWVKKGIYTLGSQINVNKAVAIYGGFAGTETELNQRDWQNNVTTIDGDNETRCLYITDNAIIDGFTISKGKAKGGYPDNCGGGIYTENSDNLTITNCTFTGNTAYDDGGGIHNEEGNDLTITNCTFSGNTAGYDGGGICNREGSLTITNCPFSGNTAGYDGGGICNREGSLTITNCTFTGNTAYDDGGGICTENSDNLTITNCILWGDNATNSGPEILNDGSTVNVSYCDVDQDGYPGNGNIRLDPLFIFPGFWDDNGTSDPSDDFWVDGNYHLQAGSPCIDNGTNTAPGLPDIDFEGGPRILDGDDNGTATVDMGADEAFISCTGDNIGVGAEGSAEITSLKSVDPASIPDNTNRPRDLRYGLIDITISVENPGDTAVIKVYLPDAAPAGYKWYKYSTVLGWIDFSREVISSGIGDGAEFNDDRTEVTLYITDNGTYDDNATARVIHDPSGLGYIYVPSPTTTTTPGGGGDGGGGGTPTTTTTTTAPATTTTTVPVASTTTTAPVAVLLAITSSPVTVAFVRVPYTYNVETSADGTGLTCSLNIKPSGMEIDENTGEITWTPKLKHLGKHDVEVQIENEFGDTDVQKFVIQVKPKIMSRCPAGAVLDENEERLQILRKFRDNRLLKSAIGLSLVSLYYTHGQEITGILYSNPDIMIMSKELSLEILPAMDSGMTIQNKITLTKSQKRRITDLMRSIKEKSSPELKKTISFILKTFESDNLLKQIGVGIE